MYKCFRLEHKMQDTHTYTYILIIKVDGWKLVHEAIIISLIQKGRFGILPKCDVYLPRSSLRKRDVQLSSYISIFTFIGIITTLSLNRRC